MGEWELDRLVRVLDANSEATREESLMVADALEQGGRYWEACILRESNVWAADELPCGHLHIRPVGVGFNLGQLCVSRGASTKEISLADFICKCRKCRRNDS